jgi:hypothetical protein
MSSEINMKVKWASLILLTAPILFVSCVCTNKDSYPYEQTATDDTAKVINDFCNNLRIVAGSWHLDEGLPDNPTMTADIADYQTVNCAIRANCSLVFHQMEYWKDTWDLVEKEKGLFIISGYCLGYSKENLVEGEWYYNETAEDCLDKAAPKSYTAEQLYDFINALGEYTPTTNGWFPNDGQTMVPVTDFYFVWQPMPDTRAYRLKISRDEDLRNPIVETTIKTWRIPAYHYVDSLEHDSTYYWKVEQQPLEYWVGYDQIRQFSTCPDY